MQNSSLFQRGTDFLLLLPFALSPPPPGEKRRHRRPGAAARRATKATRRVSFWECGTGARLVYCSEQWVSGGGVRCQSRERREGASGRGREGGRAPLSAHTLLIDFARVPTSCRNTLRVSGSQKFSLNAGYWVAAVDAIFLISRLGSGGISKPRAPVADQILFRVHRVKKPTRKKKKKRLDFV